MTPLEKYIKATNTHDFDNVRILLSNDAVYYFTDASLNSHSSIQTYFEKSWHLIPDEEYWVTDINCLQDDSNTKVYTYQYNYKGHIDGVPVQGFGRATNVFVLQDGDFKLIHEHLSVESK